jgi:hypothetical protein
MSVAINGSELLTRPSEEQDLDREEEEDGEEHFRGIGCGMPRPACSMLRVLPSATVQTLLGHTSSEVTREHYIQAVSSESREVVGRIEELAIGPKWTQVGPEGKKSKR